MSISKEENKYLSVIDYLCSNEVKRVHKLSEILSGFCEENSNVADLIEIIFWDNCWSTKPWRNTSIESYMKQGIHKILDALSVNYEEPSINYEYETDSDVIEIMSNHTIILENILVFLSKYIHTRITDSKKECMGIVITVNDDKLSFDIKSFKNEKEMSKNGYHNDAKYYLSSLNEYAVNCVYGSNKDVKNNSK